MVGHALSYNISLPPQRDLLENPQRPLIQPRTHGGRNFLFANTLYLLLEVASLFFVDEHEVQVITYRELFINVSHGRSHLVASQEKTDWNGFA